MNIKSNATFSNIPTYVKKHVTFKSVGGGGNVSTSTKMSNLKLYDTRNIIDLTKIHEDFNHLSKDKYKPKSHNYKNITTYYYNGLNIIKKRDQPTYHYGHNNKVFHYDHYNTLHPKELTKILTLFIQLSRTPSHSDIRVEAKRVLTTPSVTGKPSKGEGWHRGGHNKTGILCVSRHNIKNGVNMFKNPDLDIETEITLKPHDMIIFDDTKLVHNTTDIDWYPYKIYEKPSDGKYIGVRDVLIMSW